MVVSVAEKEVSAEVAEQVAIVAEAVEQVVIAVVVVAQVAATLVAAHAGNNINRIL